MITLRSKIIAHSNCHYSSLTTILSQESRLLYTRGGMGEEREEGERRERRECGRGRRREERGKGRVRWNGKERGE